MLLWISWIINSFFEKLTKRAYCFISLNIHYNDHLLQINFYFSSVQEVFSWLLEASDDSSDLWDGGRITWSVRYASDAGSVADDTSPSEHSSEENPSKRKKRNHFLSRRNSGDRDYDNTHAKEAGTTKQSQINDSEKFGTDATDDYSDEIYNDKTASAETVTHKSKISKNKKYVPQKDVRENNHESDKIELRYSSVDDEGHVVERKTILNAEDAVEMESAKIDDEEVLMKQYPTDEELNVDDEPERDEKLSTTEKYLDTSSKADEGTEGCYIYL